MLMSIPLQCYKTDAEKKNHHSICKGQGNVSQVTAQHTLNAFINLPSVKNKHSWFI